MANNRGLVLQQSHAKLQKFLDEKAAALPKDFNETRFLQNCMTVLQDVKGIENMSPVSVARTMLKGAFLGLDFFNGECYAIPYGGALNFQTDYKGEIKLAKKYSINSIKDIYAKLVREDDFFEERIENGQQIVNFEPKSFNDGKVIGAFAVCLYHDGSMIYDSMSSAEIEHIRENFSKAKNSPAWTKTPGEMYKKTVLRRLCKLIELDFESAEQKVAFDDSGDSKVKENQKPEEKSPFDDDVVDVDFEVEEGESDATTDQE